jgi:DNA-binding MarR family transcriptional regulator
MQLSKSLQETLVLTILELAAQLSRRGDIISEKVGITTQQWIIMLYIYGDPNIPYIEKNNLVSKSENLGESGILASEIAEALNVSRPNITNIINSLVEKGLIEQHEDPNDRRRRRLRVTPKGIQLLEEIEPVRRHANIALFSKVAEKELRLMLTNMQHLMRRLNKEE